MVLIADTNQERAAGDIMADIYPGVTDVVGSSPRITCCYPIYLHAFDRVIAAGFQSNEASMTSIFPFGAGDKHAPPDWAIMNMHDPVIAEFSLGGDLKFGRGTVKSTAVREACHVRLASFLMFLLFANFQAFAC